MYGVLCRGVQLGVTDPMCPLGVELKGFLISVVTRLDVSVFDLIFNFISVSQNVTRQLSPRDPYLYSLY
jgi:hypothetical protein